MPPSEAPPAAWRERDGLLVEERLSALGLRHGFTTARRGSMRAPEASRAAAAALGLPAPLLLKQVHGAEILPASAENAGREADGWLIDSPGVCAGVYVADCVPLFLWSDDGRLAGVFHAGWRGTAKGMARAAVAAFAARGVRPERLSAALGPHAGPCCYRVGPELEAEFPASAFARRGGALYLDLGAETRRQLAGAGVPAGALGAPAPCTVCAPDDYFSFRRDKRVERMLALLSIDR
jgi:YfiH family protein